MSTYEGRPAVLMIMRDVSERRRAEEQIRYQADLVENVSDAIISTDLDFNIVSWNRGAEVIYGWRSDEVAGKTVNEVTMIEYPFDEMEDVLRRLEFDFENRGTKVWGV